MPHKVNYVAKHPPRPRYRESERNIIYLHPPAFQCNIIYAAGGAGIGRLYYDGNQAAHLTAGPVLYIIEIIII